MNPSRHDHSPWKLLLKDWCITPKAPWNWKPKPPSTLLSSFQATTPSSTFLLQLPREIRDLIYDHLFAGARFQYFETELSVDLFYGPYTSDYHVSHIAPQWLGTCKTLLVEGLEQFYREARCVGVFGSDKKRLSALSPNRLLSLTRITRVDLSRHITDLRFDDQARYLFEADRERDRQRQGHAVLKPSSSRTVYQHGTCPFLWEEKHFVKDLTLRFALPEGCWSNVRPAMTSWAIDCGVLEKLGSAFDRVSFVVDTPLARAGRSERGLREVQTMVCLYRMVQIELERLGRVLVGGDEVVYGMKGRHECFVAQNEQYHFEVRRLRGGVEKRDVGPLGLQQFWTREGRRYKRLPKTEGDESGVVRYFADGFFSEQTQKTYPENIISVHERTDGVIPLNPPGGKDVMGDTMYI